MTRGSARGMTVPDVGSGALLALLRIGTESLKKWHDLGGK